MQLPRNKAVKKQLPLFPRSSSPDRKESGVTLLKGTSRTDTYFTLRFCMFTSSSILDRSHNVDPVMKNHNGKKQRRNLYTPQTTFIKYSIKYHTPEVLHVITWGGLDFFNVMLSDISCFLLLRLCLFSTQQELWSSKKLYG